MTMTSLESIKEEINLETRSKSTIRQRHQLKKLKKQIKVGYFHRGRLMIRETLKIKTDDTLSNVYLLELIGALIMTLTH